MSEFQVPALIEAAGERIHDAIMAIGGWLDRIWGCVLEKCNDLGNAFSERMTELKTSVGKSISNLRPSPTPDIGGKSVTSPSIEPSVEQVMSREDRVAEVKNALACAGFSGVGFQISGESLADDTPADLGGVGCSSHISVRARSGMAMSMN